MRELVWVFGRAFAIVCLTAMNVVWISHSIPSGAFLSGCLISYVWWGNTNTAVTCQHPWGRQAYSLGAGCGTVIGMTLAGWLKGFV